MRLVRLLFFALLFAAGEVAVPVVAPASAAVEEAAEEIQHADSRRRGSRQPAAVRMPTIRSIRAALRPSTRVLSRTTELNRRNGLRKIPPPSSAIASAPEEAH